MHAFLRHSEYEHEKPYSMKVATRSYDIEPVVQRQQRVLRY